MSEIDVVAVHHRAGARDDGDVVITTVVDRLRRDTRPFPKGLVHPDATNAGIIAVVHDALRRFWPCNDHHAVDSARYRLQVGVATIAAEVFHIRIHSEYLMPGCF